MADIDRAFTEGAGRMMAGEHHREDGYPQRKGEDDEEREEVRHGHFSKTHL